MFPVKRALVAAPHFDHEVKSCPCGADRAEGEVEITMNKITKGAIAGGVGVALLLGGAGTLAYWNDQANIGAAGTITAGQLTIERDAAAASDGWTVSNNSIQNVAVDLDDFLIVPGDTLTYTATFEIVAEGDNILAEVGIGANAIAPADAQNGTDVALAGQLIDSATYTVNGASGANVTLDEGPHEVVVTVSIAWPFAGDPSDDNPAQLGQVSLDDFNVVVTQVAQP